MGSTEHVAITELTWNLGMNSKRELLPSTHQAVLRLFWRHVYAAISRLKFGKEPFSANLVKRDITSTLYCRAYISTSSHTTVI
eukprot:4506716-Pleurochrysis_carterae.AAC.2